MTAFHRGLALAAKSLRSRRGLFEPPILRSAPHVPENVAATLTGLQVNWPIRVTWTQPVEKEARNELTATEIWSKADDGEWTLKGSVPKGTLLFDDTSNYAAYQVKYRLAAKNASGFTAYSKEAIVEPKLLGRWRRDSGITTFSGATLISRWLSTHGLYALETIAQTVSNPRHEVYGFQPGKAVRLSLNTLSIIYDAPGWHYLTNIYTVFAVFRVSGLATSSLGWIVASAGQFEITWANNIIKLRTTVVGSGVIELASPASFPRGSLVVLAGRWDFATNGIKPSVLRINGVQVASTNAPNVINGPANPPGVCFGGYYDQFEFPMNQQAADIYDVAIYQHALSDAAIAAQEAALMAEYNLVDQPPWAPENLAGVKISQTRIDLTWALNPNSNNETDIEIWRADDGVNYNILVATVIARTVSYSDTSVIAFGLYTYRVRAKNPSGASAYSNATPLIDTN